MAGRGLITVLLLAVCVAFTQVDARQLQDADAAAADGATGTNTHLKSVLSAVAGFQPPSGFVFHLRGSDGRYLYSAGGSVLKTESLAVVGVENALWESAPIAPGLPAARFAVGIRNVAHPEQVLTYRDGDFALETVVPDVFLFNGWVFTSVDDEKPDFKLTYLPDNDVPGVWSLVRPLDTQLKSFLPGEYFVPVGTVFQLKGDGGYLYSTGTSVSKSEDALAVGVENTLWKSVPSILPRLVEFENAVAIRNVMHPEQVLIYQDGNFAVETREPRDYPVGRWIFTSVDGSKVNFRLKFLPVDNPAGVWTLLQVGTCTAAAA